MKKKLDHFILSNQFRESHSYAPTRMGGGGKKDNWGGDRKTHGKKLISELKEALSHPPKFAEEFYDNDDIGNIIEVEIEPGFEEILRNLDSKKSGIQLLSIREGLTKESETEKLENTVYAKIFIPHGKTDFLTKKLNDYLEKETKYKKPKNKAFVESIKSINKVVLESFWTDNIKLLPQDEDKFFKWEIWLRVTSDDEIEIIKQLCNKYEIKAQEKGYLKFPDRSVIVVLANRHQIYKLLESTDRIAELRKAKETAEFFIRLNNSEQKEWSEELLKRIQKNENPKISICIFDTGVNNKHLLIKDFLNDSNLQAYKSNWTASDQVGHGTEMAGVCLYGDLAKSLQSTDKISIDYILESVRILNHKDPNDIESYGYVTDSSVSIAEINNVDIINRIFCMTVTSRENSDFGKPSSWSSAIDKITSEKYQKRLFIISGGNIPLHEITSNDYTVKNELESIHDPGQSWNAIVVGAYTEYDNIEDIDPLIWSPLAPKDDLSPVSTTSLTWQKYWANKPDIVMEGGNCATDGNLVDFTRSLSLLTTHYNFDRLFTVTGDTSAAAALASQMAAKIWSKYPKLKPETVRALIIHSACWKPAMIKRAVNGTSSKSQKYNYLLRCYGYGVPDEDKALWSMKSELTLIVEDSIQPYKQTEKKEIKMNEIHFHKLPLPKEILTTVLAESELEMKVTLSYFIEPCPGERGRNSKHRYSSYGLRFKVKSPTEQMEDFKKRLNMLAREENEEVSNDNDNDRWLLGENLRSRGSIHSDVWRGSGASLAEKDSIAIYPVSGWWREKPELENSEMISNYSLLITIKTDKTNIDIYTPVQNLVTIKTAIEL